MSLRRKKKTAINYAQQLFSIYAAPTVSWAQHVRGGVKSMPLSVRGDLGENGKFSPPRSAHEDTPLLELRFPIAVIRSFPNPHT